MKSELSIKYKNEWSKVRIKELGKVITGKTPSSKNPEYFGSDYPFITASDLHVNRFIDKTERGISKEAEKKFSNIMLPKNSVIVSCIGWQMGKTAIVTRKSLTNQQINGIIVDTKKADPFYIYYTLKIMRDDFFRLASSGTRTPILKKSLFEEQQIFLPPLSTQQHISGILSAIDSKIESIRNQKKKLEKMVQSIFKSWFIDFDEETEFINSEIGEIPKKWNISILSENTVFDIGGIWGKKNPDKINNLPSLCIRGMDIPEIQNGNVESVKLVYCNYSKQEKRKLTAGDIIIEISGGSPTQLTGRSLFINEELLSRFQYSLFPGSFCKLIRIKKRKYAEFFYWFLRWIYDSKIIQQYETGSTGIKNFQYTVFSNDFKFTIPNENYIEKFHLLAFNISRLQEKLLKQIQILNMIKNTILPKLMSGEIRV